MTITSQHHSLTRRTKTQRLRARDVHPRPRPAGSPPATATASTSSRRMHEKFHAPRRNPAQTNDPPVYAYDRQGEVRQVRRAEVDSDRQIESFPSRSPICSRAQWSTNSVSERVRPLCSASGRNCAGPSSPSDGCAQRTSASTPRTIPVVSSA